MAFRLPNGEDLSEEQLDIINLPLTKDWVIKGAPGTGKTVMAIYRAGQASQMGKNEKVLMLVYNNPLMKFLSTAVQGNYYKNVEISTYHQWIGDVYTENGWGRVPKDEDGDHDWDTITADMSHLRKMYSHVIIDEAQDFPIELLKILKRVSKHITCFIDPNQAIIAGKTDTHEAIKTLCVEAPYTLTRNFRNTKQIRDLSALFCKDGEPAPAYINGKKPVMVKCTSSDFDEMNRRMADIINRNKEKSIGVIVNYRAVKKTYEFLKENFSRRLDVQRHQSMGKDKLDFTKNGVKVVSYGTMKGLEFDIVLLPMFDKIPMVDGNMVDANRVYVALSRPVEELYMFYWKKKPTAGKINTMGPITAHSKLVDWK